MRRMTIFRFKATEALIAAAVVAAAAPLSAQAVDLSCNKVYRKTYGGSSIL